MFKMNENVSFYGLRTVYEVQYSKLHDKKIGVFFYISI